MRLLLLLHDSDLEADSRRDDGRRYRSSVEWPTGIRGRGDGIVSLKFTEVQLMLFHLSICGACWVHVHWT
jgi:hypothetical protein